MRPLVWWVQDHLGLAAVGLLGLIAAVVVVALIASGGSGSASDAGAEPSEVAASETTKAEKPESGQASGGELAAPAAAKPEHQHQAGHKPVAAPSTRHKAHPQEAEQTHTGGAETTSRKNDHHHADHAATDTSSKAGGSPPADEAGRHSLDQATAEKVAAAHPDASCPKNYSRKQCEEAVQAAATPSPSTSVTQPSDCTKSMSAAQCEELFAAEAAAREAGGTSVAVQECMERPEQEKCTAVVEQMEAQYEAAHPGG